MNKPAQKTEWIVWGGLVMIIIAIGGSYLWSRLAEGGLPLPVIGQISDFSLTNQDGRPFSLATMGGQVWIADVIFTRCPGPCAKMTRHLAELQSALPANKPARLVTFTSDPDFDTPAVLKHYAERFGADVARWSFVTGNRQEIRRLAVNDFRFVVVEKKPEEREVPDDLFIHSTWFALVDQKGRVRGWTDRDGQLHAYFDSEDPETKARILNAVSQLSREK